MSIYVPNLGEKEALMDILVSQAFRLGLYKAHVTPDGNTIFATMTELDAEAGGYQTKDLSNIVVTDALAAAKWFVTSNADGKAEATYGAADGPQEWTFIADDIANGDTAYGVFMWTIVLPFTSGGTEEILVGDTVTGLIGAATGVVTSVRLNSGTWAGGDAVGEFCIKTQTGTFEAEGIKRVTNDCATIAADSEKRIILIEAFATEQAIDTAGQKIQYTPKITLSTAV